MPTLLALAEIMEERAKTFEDKANDLVKNVISEIAEDLIYITTPVDTSQALSNWRIGLDGPIQGFRPPYDTGSYGSTRISSASSAFAVANKVIEARKLRTSTYISNAVPYIGFLDRGKSKQFSGDFGARALLIARSTFKRQANKLL